MAKSTIVTGEGRLLYANIAEAKDGKFSLAFVWPKSDKATTEKIQGLIQESIEGSTKFDLAATKKKNFGNPLRDGDEDREDDELFEDSYFVNVKSQYQPQVYDTDRNELSAKEIYSGAYGRVKLNGYDYLFNGKPGVGLGLIAIQKTKDGEKLGGNSNHADDFAV